MRLMWITIYSFPNSIGYFCVNNWCAYVNDSEGVYNSFKYNSHNTNITDYHVLLFYNIFKNAHFKKSLHLMVKSNKQPVHFCKFEL